MLYGNYEFRGFENKTSSKGNNYVNLFCEDVENGQAVRFYVGANQMNSCNPPISNLVKGDIIKITCNYHQGYGGGMTTDFIGYTIE